MLVIIVLQLLCDTSDVFELLLIIAEVADTTVYESGSSSVGIEGLSTPCRTQFYQAGSEAVIRYDTCEYQVCERCEFERSIKYAAWRHVFDAAVSF